MQGFDPVVKIPSIFVEFCKCLNAPMIQKKLEKGKKLHNDTKCQFNVSKSSAKSTKHGNEKRVPLTMCKTGTSSIKLTDMMPVNAKS